MDREYDFSVIVLCYNPDFEKLKKTIISILNQKGTTFEIIISDDCSSNDYIDELSKWIIDNNIDNIKCNFLKENVGTVSNYLSALNIATGKYVKPISPGDYLYDENSLKCYYDNFKDNTILFSDSIYYYEDKIICNKQYPTNYSIFIVKKLAKNYLVYGIFFLGATICSERKYTIETLTKITGNIKYLEDYSLICISLVEKVKIFGIRKPLMWYEYGTGISTITKVSDKLIIDTENVIKYLFSNYKNNKYCKIMMRKNKLQKSNFLIKALSYSIISPKTFYYKIYNKLVKKDNYNAIINDMYRITQLKQRS